MTQGIATPESVLYDEVRDRYLVSNINGEPDALDNNGFISEIAPDGKVVNEKFIAGGVAGVKLNGPKGSAISNGVLYVSDIDVVRMFDPASGVPEGEIKVPGATFLNDIAIARDGRVFVSDSGIRSSAKGFVPTGTDAVYEIDEGTLRTFAKGKKLGGPNGLLAVDTGLLVVTFGTDELYRLDAHGIRRDITKLPNGILDGIIQSGTDLFVTSWQQRAVFRGTLRGKFEVAFGGLKSAADIGIDPKRSRLLVPLFQENAVEVYNLK